MDHLEAFELRKRLVEDAKEASKSYSLDGDKVCYAAVAGSLQAMLYEVLVHGPESLKNWKTVRFDG